MTRVRTAEAARIKAPKMRYLDRWVRKMAVRRWARAELRRMRKL